MTLASGMTLDVASEDMLNQAIALVDAAGAGSYTIRFTGNITEGTDAGTQITYGTQTLSVPLDLYAINLAAGVSLTIDGGSHTLDGANAYRGLFVYAGNVTIQNLTIANATAIGGAGGRGGSFSTGAGGGGGGGLGAGGDIFVQQGGALIVEGGTLAGGSVTGGTGANPGQAYGTGIFIHADSGTEEITFSPGAGQTLAIADAITDEWGSAATGGHGGLIVTGGGTVKLTTIGNNYTGGSTIEAGSTLEVGAGSHRGFVYSGGSLLLENLTIAGANASGGAGGGLLVGSGGIVTLENLTFSNDSASGGDIAVQSGGTAIVAGGGTVKLGDGFSGGLTIEGGSTLEIAGTSLSGSGTVAFSGFGTLRWDGATFSTGSLASISGFAAADVLHLASVAPGAVTIGCTAGSGTVNGIGVTGSFSGLQIVSDGGSGSYVAPIATLDVSTEAQLNQTLATVDAAVAGSYTIRFTSNIQEGTDSGASIVFGAQTLSAPADLYAINLASGVNLTIDGGGHTLNGMGAYRGLFVYAGTVTVQHLTIADAVAVGGLGGGVGGGGGGAGLGGGVFVASGATVTIDDVAFLDDAAVGGAGGGPLGWICAAGGGGGMGGAGGIGVPVSKTVVLPGGGGGIGSGAAGAYSQISLTAGAGGIVLGAAAGAASGNSAAGGAYGGGGASGRFSWGGGGCTGGAGGFGGFGAGNGVVGRTPFGGGGSGLGASGDIFLQQGGTHIVEGGSLSGGSVAGGASAGAGYGTGIFIQADSGTQEVTFAPGAGETLAVADAISDEWGSAGTGGHGGLIVGGAGTVLLTSADNDYTGGSTIEAGGTLEIGAGASAGSGAVAFSGAGALQWDGATHTAGSIGGIIGFAAGDHLHLATIAPGSVAVTSTPNNGSIGGISATGTFLGLMVTSDGASGSVVFTVPSLGAPCFAAGTRIVTTRGAVAVEALRVGDAVRLARGGTAPVIWLGWRSVDCRRHPRPWDVQPVRIAPDAFGAGQPQRPLLLSPDLAAFIDGVLIPIRYLLNGTTIVQQPVERVTYWHVELDRHNVLLAEGMACESYLDTGNRSAFANGGGAIMMQPDFALRVWESKSCAELVMAGAELEAARSFLLWRAEMLGHVLTRDPGLHLRVGESLVWPSVSGAAYRFELPLGAKRVRLVPWCSVPTHVHDDCDDYRRLGVAASRLVLDGDPINLTDARLGSGWHGLEGVGTETHWRWTDGDAELLLSGGGSPSIDVVMTARYWLQPPMEETKAGQPVPNRMTRPPQSTMTAR